MSWFTDVWQRLFGPRIKVEFANHAHQIGQKRLGGTGSDDSLNIPEPFKSAHGHSWKNRSELMASEACGCFYCGKVYSPKEIHEWHDEELTAFCPRCGIDAIIGSASGLPLTADFLENMNKYWFGHGFVDVDFQSQQ